MEGVGLKQPTSLKGLGHGPGLGRSQLVQGSVFWVGS